MNYKFLILLFFISLFIKAQVSTQDKSILTKRTDMNIKIDGELDEEAWNLVEPAVGFTEFEPNNNRPEQQETKSEVKVLYDDNGIYIGAVLYFPKRDSLVTRLADRDNLSNSDDWFLVAVNPFNDKQQYFEFGVTAGGVQFDAFGTQTNGEDDSWNAIWASKVKVYDDKYIVEFQLPYSALRFPKGDNSHWSINFIRNIANNRKKLAWVALDRNVGSFYQYNGGLNGIKGISPPTRLFFIPYISDYVTNSQGNTKNTLKGGMDLNWGINESYTLDATLIPDFGQTSFDNVQYILGPFEQQFSDKRPFFTEGVDLFNKGNLLYTRRIGAAPDYYPSLADDEDILNYPTETNLLNATKISGRSKNGLGIGVLNAITEKAYAEVKNIDTDQVSKTLVSPLTNYNVLVLDQRFKGSSSSMSFVNTSTIRNGEFRDANVSALLGDFYDRENKYNISGSLKYSHINDTKDTNGFFTSFSGSKDFGQWRYGFENVYVSKDYDINDLGINFYQNYFELSAYGSYRILEATKKFNYLNINGNSYLMMDNPTGKLQDAGFSFNFNSSDRKNNYFGFGSYFGPIKTYDFYEPRVPGRFSENQKSYNLWISNSPNYGKKFLIDKDLNVGFANWKDTWWMNITLGPRYRPNDKLLLRFNIDYGLDFNDRGYVDQVNNDIIFGNRDRRTLTTRISGNYFFNPLTSISLNFRHYYTNAKYNQFFTLQDDGSYVNNDSYNKNKDFTFNSWNMDLKFSWWFAPGSQMEILYRNTLGNSNDYAINNLGDNFQNLFKQPLSNIFSVRLTYFLDYNKLKNVFKPKAKNIDENAMKLENPYRSFRKTSNLFDDAMAPRVRKTY